MIWTVRGWWLFIESWGKWTRALTFENLDISPSDALLTRTLTFENLDMSPSIALYQLQLSDTHQENRGIAGVPLYAYVSLYVFLYVASARELTPLFWPWTILGLTYPLCPYVCPLRTNSRSYADGERVVTLCVLCARTHELMFLFWRMAWWDLVPST